MTDADECCCTISDSGSVESNTDVVFSRRLLPRLRKLHEDRHLDREPSALKFCIKFLLELIC